MNDFILKTYNSLRGMKGYLVGVIGIVIGALRDDAQIIIS